MAKKASKAPPKNTQTSKKKSLWAKLRLVGLFTMIVVGALGYTILWQAVSRNLISEAEMAMDRLRDRGFSVRYARLEASGFPYRISLDFLSPTVVSTSGAVEVRADKVSFISHLWTPDQWVAETAASRISTPLTGRLEVPGLKASWRKIGEEGDRIILDASGLKGEEITLSKAVIGLVLPGDKERQRAEALLGDAVAALTLNMASDGWALQGATTLSGAPLFDWSTQALADFRDEGGLWDLTNLTLKLDQYPITIKGSLTLDQDLNLLGTLDLTPIQELPAFKGIVGEWQRRLDLVDQPLSLSLQNGGLFVDGAYKGDLPKLLP